MLPIFRPLRGLVVFLFLLLLVFPLVAVDKKRKAPAPEPNSKAKAKVSPKTDPKQQAKSARDNGRDAGKNKKDDKNKQQLAQKKKGAGEEKPGRKAGKDDNKLATRQREEKGNVKGKTAKLEAEKKDARLKDKTAQRTDNKKSDHKEIATKKSAPEKNTSASTRSELKAEATKRNDKSAKREVLRETVTRKEEAKATKPDVASSLAKNNAKLAAKTESRQQGKEEGLAKELPQVKFALRPITKVVPKVELKFSLARALTTPAFDAPPPRDVGPDVIDVIEHDSSDAKRLDALLQSEMKTIQFSGIPSTSNKKIDVGKMDEDRIRQIQEVLAKKGYYTGEVTGQYDDATVEAMRKFQVANRIDVTGYATAQSLRLLGLTDW